MVVMWVKKAIVPNFKEIFTRRKPQELRTAGLRADIRNRLLWNVEQKCYLRFL
jgi:hypothetical protein